VLSFGPEAEALEPASLRDEVISRLEAAQAAG
jgi:predicted DNA-binding transcriptional regulator YafY